jgi:hypothetical protein
MRPLVRVAVDYVADPMLAELHDEDERSGFYAPRTITVTAAIADTLGLLPAGEDVSLRVVDLLTDEVLVLVRHEDGGVIACTDSTYTARH